MLKRLKLTEWFEATGTIIMVLSIFAAGVAGWVEQNSRIRALDNRLTATETLIGVKISQAIEGVAEFKIANEKDHDEIKSMLRDLSKRSTDGTSGTDSRVVRRLP